MRRPRGGGSKRRWTVNTPPSLPDDWNYTELEDGRLRFDGPDRRVMVMVTYVTTHGGDVYHCQVYRSDNPHGWGKRITSAIAETESQILPTVLELYEEARV